MWTLLNIKATNLCAFQKLDYTLKQGVTTLISGNNLDNDSQGSNGSGKSAMLEAISIGITGETLRKIKIEEIINDSFESAEVSEHLYDNSTDEHLEVTRYLGRGETQKISCISYQGSNTDAKTIITQSSIADYNSFILDKIGLSKDDIFSNFILSKHKFKSFLSSSDKDKKDIINRFSNGNIVDESIEIITEDMAPISKSLQEAETKVANLNGSVYAMEDQITKAVNKAEEDNQSKAKRLNDLNLFISNKRSEIRAQQDERLIVDARLDELDKLNNTVCDMENKNDHSVECYLSLKDVFAEFKVKPLSDWQDKVKSSQRTLFLIEEQQSSLKRKADELKKQVVVAQNNNEKTISDAAKFNSLYSSNVKKLNAKSDEVSNKLNEIVESISNSRKKQRLLDNEIASLNNSIAGTITCPKCKYEFVLDDSVDIEATRESIADKQKALKEACERVQQEQQERDNLEAERVAIRGDKSVQDTENERWSDMLTKSKIEANKLYNNQLSIENEQAQLVDKINAINKEISSTHTLMFNEAYGIIDDACYECDNSIKQIDNNISVYKGAIRTYQQSIEELNNIDETDLLSSLRKSKNEYEKSLSEALSKQNEIEGELNRYKEQILRFVEFKTHLANTKIEALSHITNEFLEAIGSDIRIQYSGFTMLKSGKVRDKISISLIRDGIDCGSFDKFSEGEKTRVNLANILAMHKLTNVNCNDSKGLDLLVLDEILESTDEAGLSNIFNALNQLKITSLVVSHGNIAENYPHQVTVNKLNGISYINQ